MGKKNILSLLILAGVILALPLGLGNSYYLNVLVFVGIYSLITIGLSLLMGYTGQISLGHAAFFVERHDQVERPVPRIRRQVVCALVIDHLHGQSPVRKARLHRIGQGKGVF